MSARLVSCSAWLLILPSCASPEHELLASRGEGDVSSLAPGGSGGTGGTGGAVGTAGSGPATGGCPSGGCIELLPCQSDRNCGPRNSPSVCVDGTCVACDALPMTPPVCVAGWTAMAVARNGCLAWKCSPPTRCMSDGECPPGEIRYAGVDCQPPPDGFAGPPPPAVCRGNLCGPPGCPDTARLDCIVVGCANGFACQSSCPPSVCVCDAMTHQWFCDPACGASQCLPPS